MCCDGMGGCPYFAIRIVVVVIGSRVFPFRGSAVRFETPPQLQRKKVSSVWARASSECEGARGNDTVPPMIEVGIVSPEIAQFGRHLVSEVEERALVQLQSG